jgi:hypothetical protein
MMRYRPLLNHGQLPAAGALGLAAMAALMSASVRPLAASAAIKASMRWSSVLPMTSASVSGLAVPRSATPATAVRT